MARSKFQETMGRTLMAIYPQPSAAQPHRNIVFANKAAVEAFVRAMNVGTIANSLGECLNRFANQIPPADGLIVTMEIGSTIGAELVKRINNLVRAGGIYTSGEVGGNDIVSLGTATSAETSDSFTRNEWETFRDDFGKAMNLRDGLNAVTLRRFYGDSSSRGVEAAARDFLD